MSELEPTLKELQDDGYSLSQAAYLVMETALAKRILEDRKRDGQWKGHGWEDLVQTSHESLWQAARREAGLPDRPAFKSDIIQRVPSTQEVERDRDALWCSALLQTLESRDVEKVTKRFNEMRTPYEVR